MRRKANKAANHLLEVLLCLEEMERGHLEEAVREPAEAWVEGEEDREG